jgi:DNA polymerase/3'-5' exonuclease PolX
MSEGRRRHRKEIEEVVDGLLHVLEPATHRIEMAGSWRRLEPWIGDLEIVAIPKVTAHDPPGMLPLGIPENVNAVWLTLDDLRQRGAITTPAGSKSSAERLWREKRAPDAAKMLKFHLVKPNVDVDLFLPTPETWGSIFTIRTGSADFAAGMVTYAHQRGIRFEKGRLRRGPGGPLLDTPEERDVFEALPIPFVAPEDRNQWRRR